MPDRWPMYGHDKPAAPPAPPKPKWEMVTNDSFGCTSRLKVSGGWLYRVEVTHCEYGVGAVGHSMQLCFVPEVKAQ
jgi:hypothetical protein